MVRIQARAGFSFAEDRAMAAYLEDIKDSKPLSRAEERVLFHRIRGGDRKALNELVRANLKFVVSVCAKYRNQGVPFGDLINEGNIGLIRAARRFDVSQDFRFITYAVWWVRQAVLSALAEQSRLFPMNTNRVGVLCRMEKAATSLAMRESPEAAVLKRVAEAVLA